MFLPLSAGWFVCEMQKVVPFQWKDGGEWVNEGHIPFFACNIFFFIYIFVFVCFCFNKQCLNNNLKNVGVCRTWVSAAI